MDQEPVSEARKQFADEVMSLIHAELGAILDGKERSQITECDELMVMCLNRLGVGVMRLKFGKSLEETANFLEAARSGNG